jgi:hypothetical protein
LCTPHVHQLLSTCIEDLVKRKAYWTSAVAWVIRCVLGHQILHCRQLHTYHLIIYHFWIPCKCNYFYPVQVVAVSCNIKYVHDVFYGTYGTSACKRCRAALKTLLQFRNKRTCLLKFVNNILQALSLYFRTQSGHVHY